MSTLSMTAQIPIDWLRETGVPVINSVVVFCHARVVFLILWDQLSGQKIVCKYLIAHFGKTNLIDQSIHNNNRF